MKGKDGPLRSRWSLRRLLTGALVPAPIGAMVYGVISVFAKMHRGHVPSLDLPAAIFGTLFFSLAAYVFVGIQSVLYSCLMEFLVNRKIRNDAVVVAISAVLGSLALPWPDAEGQVFFSQIGAIVGLIVGALLRTMYKKAANQAL